jgi:hypothetical protein
MMPAFIDNRAADLVAVFCPLPSNVTVAPRLAPFGGAQDFPTPGTPAWSHFNRRRAELIRRKVRSGLSHGEGEELDWLQRETLAAVDRAFPRPPVDLRSLAELEKRLNEGPELETP